MIILATYKDKKGKLLVSHGCNIETGENVVLPCVPPEQIGKYDYKLGEWVINV